MPTIRKEIPLAAPADAAWDAVRDVGAVHRRLAPGFVTDTRLDGDARVVTFATGHVVRERLVAVDDAERRVAYAAAVDGATHHHASMQVLPDGPGRSRLVWITDVLPDAAAEAIRPLIEHGAVVMQRALGAGVA